MMSKGSMNDPKRNPFVLKIQSRLRWRTRPGHAGERKVTDDFRSARCHCLKRGYFVTKIGKESGPARLHLINGSAL